MLYTLQSMHLVDDDRVVRGLGKFLASFQVLLLDDEEVLPLALELWVFNDFSKMFVFFERRQRWFLSKGFLVCLFV